MDLLGLRNALKKRKPVFLAQGWYKRKRIRKRWRRPRGLHSKMRLQKKGKPSIVSSGWRSPAAVRGLNRQGLREVVIRSVKDLDLLGEGRIGVFHTQLSLKTRLELIRLAEERGVMLDPRQVARAQARAKALEERRAKRAARATRGEGDTADEQKKAEANEKKAEE